MPRRTIKRVDHCSEVICKRLGSLGLDPGSPSMELENAGMNVA